MKIKQGAYQLRVFTAVFLFNTLNMAYMWKERAWIAYSIVKYKCTVLKLLYSHYMHT